MAIFWRVPSKLNGQLLNEPGAHYYIYDIQAGLYIYIYHIRQSICSNKTCDSPKVFRFCYPLRRGLMPTCCPMATVPSSNFCGHWWRRWRISFSYNWVPPTKVAFSILHPPVDSVKKTSDLKHFGILGFALWFLMSSAVLFIGRLTIYV